MVDEEGVQSSVGGFRDGEGLGLGWSRDQQENAKLQAGMGRCGFGFLGGEVQD